MSIRNLLAYILILLVEALRIAALQAHNPTMPWQIHVKLSILHFICFFLLWHFFVWLSKPLEKRLSLVERPFTRILMQTIIFSIIMFASNYFIIYPLQLYIGEPHGVISIESITIGRMFFITTFTALYFSTSIWELLLGIQVRSERLLKEKAIRDRGRALMRFADLKNKLDPHFLFNSITVATELVYENPEKTEQFLLQLSKVYRYVVQHYDQNLVSLKIELEFIEDYLQLLQTRFQEGFRYELDKSLEAYEEMYVIPLTLQVLLENVIKHNVVSKRHPVKVQLWATETTICIKNNLNPKKDIGLSDGVGLDNLKHQYLYYAPKPLEVIETKTSFCVKIPLLDPNTLEA